LGHKNLEAVVAVGAEPYIAFKSNSLEGSRKVWRRAFHLFQFHREEWLNHYHQRSRIECTFSSVKRVFGGSTEAGLVLLATPGQCSHLLARDRCVDDHRRTEVQAQGKVACLGPRSAFLVTTSW
jgi:hypothetical protein